MKKIEKTIEEEIAELLVYDAIYQFPYRAISSLKDEYDFTTHLNAGYIPVILDVALTILQKEDLIKWGKGGWVVIDPEKEKNVKRRLSSMNKVIITKPMQGICHMQVCAEKDTSDEEILDVCNRENPSGTKAGWSEVIRNDKEHPVNNPVTCDDHSSRTHFLVVC